MNIKVILADDHEVVREGIKAVIDKKGKDIEIIGEASNGKEVLKIAKNNPADVYLLDIAMPILNGIETTERLKKRYPKCKVVILSIYDDRSSVKKALQYGADAYLVKGTAAREIVQAIYEVYKDGYFLSPKVSKYLVNSFLGKTNHYGQKDNETNLTRREREILQLIAEGYTNKEMAINMDLSYFTVQAHRNNIMRKLDLHKQADLIRYALKEGFSHL